MTALTFQQFADSGTDGMTRDEALAKLISIRHHCFVRGVLGRSAQDDFRQAFRTLNRFYVCLRDRPERHSDTNGRAASQFSRLCPTQTTQTQAGVACNRSQLGAH